MHTPLLACMILGTVQNFPFTPEPDSLAGRVLEKYQTMQTYSAQWNMILPDSNEPVEAATWQTAFDRKSKKTLSFLYGGQGQQVGGMLAMYDGTRFLGAMSWGENTPIEKGEKQIPPEDFTYRDFRRSIPHLYPFDLPLVFSETPFEEVIQSEVGQIREMNGPLGIPVGFEIIPGNPDETRARFFVDPNSLLIDRFDFVYRGSGSSSPQFQCSKVVVEQPLDADLFNMEKQFQRLAGKSSADLRQAPWITLFNGRDLTGWSVIGSRGQVEVIEDAIVCHMTRNTPEHTFVRTNAKYSDFILELDCKLEGDFHTGVLFRCVDAPADADVRLFGYQVKIDPTPRKWTGGIFDDFGKSWNWLYTLKEDERARQAFVMDEWNHFRIEAIGPQLQVWVNDVPTTNLIHTKYSDGYIALKIHSLGNNTEKEKIPVRYKNIRILTENLDRFRQPMDIPPLKVD